MAFVRELSGTTADAVRNHRIWMREEVAKETEGAIAELKSACVIASKKRKTSASCHRLVWNPDRDVADEIIVNLKKSLQKELCSLGFKELRASDFKKTMFSTMLGATSNVTSSYDPGDVYIDISVRWPQQQQQQQPEQPEQPEQTPRPEQVNLEGMRADINRAVSAMARCEPAERSRQLNALRLKWHPDKAMPDA
jgi:hypothetical protein